MSAFAAAGAVLREAIAAHVFPAAAVEVGSRESVMWREAFGHITYDAAAPPTTPDTIFDLASLTKVIATATLTMRAIDAELLHLDDPVGRWIPHWRGADRESVTIRHLLAHAAGLTAYLPYYRDLTGRAEFEVAIATSPLEYEPGTRSVYSDLGFMLLGFILEDAHARHTGAWRGRLDPSSSLAAQFRPLASYLTPEPLTFRPPREWRDRIAPTEHDPWRGRLLRGEVHDENTWALGGVAGQSGLFGTAAAVGAFARAVLHTLKGAAILAAPGTMRLFATKAGIPNSSRALAWDTMLPTSSSGTKMSPTAIGHTGFTGTSLWIDWERDLYAVLLTNRVHPTRDREGIKEIRRAFHDTVWAEGSG